MSTSAKDICNRIPHEQLDSTVSDIHIANIVHHFHEWQELAPYLDLTETDEKKTSTRNEHVLQLPMRSLH